MKNHGKEVVRKRIFKNQKLRPHLITIFFEFLKIKFINIMGFFVLVSIFNICLQNQSQNLKIEKSSGYQTVGPLYASIRADINKHTYIGFLKG